MNSCIKKFVRDLLAYLGYELNQIQSLKKVLKKINRKALRPKERLLSAQALRLKKDNNHKEYELLLKHFVPAWNIEAENRGFVGKGFSISGFNSYRRIELSDSILFEKVYFNSFMDLSKILWFQQVFYPIVSQRLNIPSIINVYKGDIISIVNYEYLDLIPVKNPEELENSLIRFTKDLYELSFEEKHSIEKETIPSFIKNYQYHFQYNSYAHLAEQLLFRQGVNVEEVERLINTFPKVITHGDIYAGNAFDKNTLIDWDSFGFYPIGFDVAFAYCRIILKNKNRQVDSLQWLSDNFKDGVDQSSWSAFELSFSYFLLIFAMEYLENKQITNWEFLLRDFLNLYSKYR